MIVLSKIALKQKLKTTLLAFVFAKIKRTRIMKLRAFVPMILTQMIVVCQSSARLTQQTVHVLISATMASFHKISNFNQTFLDANKNSKECVCIKNDLDPSCLKETCKIAVKATDSGCKRMCTEGTNLIDEPACVVVNRTDCTVAENKFNM